MAGRMENNIENGVDTNAPNMNIYIDTYISFSVVFDFWLHKLTENTICTHTHTQAQNQFVRCLYSKIGRPFCFRRVTSNEMILNDNLLVY